MARNPSSRAQRYQALAIQINENLYEILAASFPNERLSILIETSEGRLISYAEVEEQSARMANLFASQGIAPGERIAVQVEKSPEAVFLYLACLRAGAVYVPLNPASAAEELDYFVEDAQPAALICDPGKYREAAECCRCRNVARLFTLDAMGAGTVQEASAPLAGSFPGVSRSGNDVAAILYSSGTTGKPKGAMLTHRNLASNAAALAGTWRFTNADVLLHALPLFHVHGLFVALHCAILGSARMLFAPRFDAREVLSLLPRTTVMMGVPTYYTRLLSLPDLDRRLCDNVRLFISGSAPLLPDTSREFHRRTGHEILERYGLTETLMNASNPVLGPRVPGSVGLPLPDVELRIACERDRPLPPDTVGEIQVRGPNVFAGYWRNAEKSEQCLSRDGFFRTGDLGRIDAAGYVSIVGRSKDLIISGGLNVYPKEVEDCINRLPGVLESAVIGMPHPDFGEAVVAVVVRQSGVAMDVDAIPLRLRGTLANYKLPKLALEAEDLPRNAMGKVQKNRLRELFLPIWRERMASKREE